MRRWLQQDRLALRELAREMAEWPYADLSGDSRLDQMAEAGGLHFPPSPLPPPSLPLPRYVRVRAKTRFGFSKQECVFVVRGVKETVGHRAAMLT